MFKRVISRDNGEPWGDTGMTSARWLDVAARTVTIADLTATQPGVLLDALIAKPAPIGGDPLPHVIDWRGELYLEDGHHRVIRALLAGRRRLDARVLHVIPTDRI